MRKNAVFFTSASEAVMRAAILIETLQLYATILPPRLKNPLQRNLSSSRTIVYRRLGFSAVRKIHFLHGHFFQRNRAAQTNAFKIQAPFFFVDRL
jgi:hypothetical protein